MERFFSLMRSLIRLTQRKWSVAVVATALFLVGLTLFSIPLSAATRAPANYIEFTMGSPEGEVGRAETKAFYQQSGIEYSETQHQVRLSDFSINKYAVTVSEFRKFVEATGYRTDAEKAGFSVIFSNGEVKKGEGVNWRCGVLGRVRPQSEDNHPVLHVSWNDAVAYCKWMTAKMGKTYRLPTEAEWEYACRAGTTTPFNTGESLTTEQANYNGNFPYKNNPSGLYRENTVPVDGLAPNTWGLYNMHGNVFEWCSDWYGGNYYDECKSAGTATNPVGPATGSFRVLRGGGWGSRAWSCRSAYRRYSTPDSRSCYIGFRVIFIP